jgi:hypothetical protein
MSEKKYRFVAIPSETASSIRTTRADDEGRPVAVRIDSGSHQCRHCLTLSEPGEPVLLTSYVPFSTRQPYAERGPIFIHQRECPRYSRPSEYPATFPKRAAVLRAYDAADEMIASQVVGDRGAEPVIEELFSDGRVAYLHARNIAEGCFMFRIERGD